MNFTDRSSRRDFVHLCGATVAAGSFALAANGAEPAAGASSKPALAADEVLERLLAGNRRFVEGKTKQPRRSPKDFQPLAEGQNPVATIVGCADSRVSPELIFDEGVGDLFVVRVAGNIVSGAGASVKGSIEYAVAELGTKLVIVLGHSQCGAVKAAIEHINDNDALPGSIGELVNTIKPAVTEMKGKPGDLLENTIRANAIRGAAKLKSLEPIIAGQVAEGKVKVVGAVYDLRTGKVSVVS